MNAILVTGIPGAGKTTVCRMLAERLPRAAHIEADVVHEMIVSGYLPPGDEPREESDRQLEVRARQCGALAAGFLEAGFVPVIDDVVLGPRRLGNYEEALGAERISLVVLAPRVEVALARDDTRGYKRLGDRWAGLDGDLRRGLAGRGLWLDTSDETPAETVDLIVDRLARGRET